MSEDFLIHISLENNIAKCLINHEAIQFRIIIKQNTHHQQSTQNEVDNEMFILYPII